MNRYHPESIRDTTLKKHFEKLGLDYALFERLVIAKVPYIRIGILFNRHRATIKKWIDIYKDEKDL